MSQISQQECFQQLDQLLQQQTTELSDINAYLSDIKNAVASGETDQLNQLLTRRHLPVAEIDDLESQRHKLLKLYGYEPDRNGLIACIRHCDQNNTLKQRYQKFEQGLSTLQHSIQLNSLLVNKGRKRVRKSLQLLTGQAASDNAQTYSSSGLSQDLSCRRKIAQA